MSIVNHTVISSLLSDYINLFNGSQAIPQNMYYFSKLAILDLGGWVEQSVDELVMGLNHKVIKSDDIDQKILQNVYGFNYDAHMRPMFIKSIGLSNIELVENNVDKNRHLVLKSSLSTLKTSRDRLAHSYTDVTNIISSPQITLNELNKIHSGLTNLETTMRKLNFLL